MLGHRAVEAVTYWGLSDAGAWLGAPVGFLRADGTPKPAYDALHRLVKQEWWCQPTPLRTDEAGRVRVRGWRGTYQLSAGGAVTAFELVKGRDTDEVRLGAPPQPAS
jgi:hypothetical protein